MYKIVKKWIPKNSHILDLGCGDGSMLLELKKELNINGLGVDISEKNIQLSLSKGLNVRPESDNSSGNEPPSEAITGRPLDIISTRGKPNPS